MSINAESTLARTLLEKMMNTLSQSIVFILLSVCLAGCSTARMKFSEARELEEQGRVEEAMFSYAEAAKNDPESADYRLQFLRTRQAAAQIRGRQGDVLFEKQRYAEAVTEYQTASGLDASQARYAQKAREAAICQDAEAAYAEGVSLEKNNKLRDAGIAYFRAFELMPKHPEYQKAVQRIAEMRRMKPEGVELHLKSTQPITLSFREARLKDVFKVVTQLSGINFIFDESVKDQNVSIVLEKATFKQALDLLVGMHKLGQKTLNETTIILYSRTPDKVKQYEEMMLRTYHLNHLDAKKAVNLVRSVLQVRKLHVNEEGNALIMRDTEDVVAVVERLLEANDVPEAEVVLDMEVVEINDKDIKNLGLLLSNYSVSLGGFSPEGKLLSSSLFPDSTAPTPVDVSQLVKAFSLKGFGGYVTVPNATYNFGKNLSRGEVLSNPKLRVRNKEKAKFNVGQRVPIQTSTTVNTTTSSSVQYVDVGVKVNAEPTIQLNNEVNIKLSLEVSSVINKETAKDGTTLVTIGTRNLETSLSLKDGETSIIGGLIQHGSSDDKVKVFILGDLPVIGPLLSNNKSEKTKSELLLAVTPRLVRGVTVPSRAFALFKSGKEDEPTLTPPYKSFDQDAVAPLHSKPPEKVLTPLVKPTAPVNAVEQRQPAPVIAAPVALLPPQRVTPLATLPTPSGIPAAPVKKPVAMDQKPAAPAKLEVLQPVEKTTRP